MEFSSEGEVPIYPEGEALERLVLLLEGEGKPGYRCGVHGLIYARKVIGDSYFCAKCLGEYLEGEGKLEAPEVID